MTTAATSLLGLALPVTGELSGTWGDTVNNSITALLDSAVAGTTTLSADADVTLTTTTLAANQAREAIILWTAAGTVTRNITAPAQSKIYAVLNKSSTQSIVLRGVGPTTGVTILAGKQAMVAWDGTDFVEVSSGYVDGPASSTDNAVARFDGTDGKLLQNSAVIIADTTGNMSGVGTLSSGAITSSSLTATRVLFAGTSGLIQDDADLTFNGTILTSTGFAGPLNGTVGATTANTGAFTTLTTSSTVTLNGGTANGVAYLNGSKVLTTGSALTFDGTNLGVGTSVPVTKLDVRATAFTPSSTLSSVLIEDKLTWAQGLQFYLNNAGTYFSSRPSGALGASNSSGLILSAGSLVTGNPDAANGYTATSTSASIYRPLNGAHSWYGDEALTAGSTFTATERMRLTVLGLEVKQSQLIGYSSYAGLGSYGLAVAGNVGIGTSSPIAKLDVGGALTDTVPATYGGTIRVNSATQTTTQAVGGIEFPVAGDGYGYKLQQISNNGANLMFASRSGSAAWTNRMTLDYAGNLGLGVTPSAWSAGRKVFESVAGAVFSENSDTFGFSQNCYNGASNWTYTTSAAAAMCRASAGAYQWFIAPSGTAGAAITFTQAMTLDASGNLGIGTTSPISKLANTASNIADAAGLTAGTSAVQWAIGVQGYAAAFYNSGAGSQFANGLLVKTTGTSNDTDAIVNFESGGVNRLKLTGAGNLGLGVTPSAVSSYRVLDMSGGSGSYISLRINGTETGNIYANTSGLSLTSVGATSTSFWTNGSERMRLDGGGNLFVGTTSSSPNPGLFVSPLGYITLGNNAQASGFAFVSFDRSGTNIGSITQNGTTAVAYNTGSDYRLKNITGPITTSGAYIDSLKPVEGTWKADGSTFVGLIAHETQEASRTPVATGTKDGEQMQGMDYSSAEIIANLIAELQSVRTRLAALEAK